MNLAQQRRAHFKNENVIEVLLTVGDSNWIKVVPGSFTDDPDATVKGPGGQVSFETRDGVPAHMPARLLLTYTHFLAAVKYDMSNEDEELGTND